MTDEERAKEIERLKSVLRSSEAAGPGYARRIEALKSRIAELEEQ